jgi:4-amino-4-deoxy-L-arabinose transferase-like glycosyltransferase
VSTRTAVLLVVAIATAYAVGGSLSHSLWSPDEPRVAEMGRRMLVTGDLVVPNLGGEPFLEKPPLYWWMMVPPYSLLGVSDRTARTVSALATALLLLLVFDLTRRIADARAGVFAALVLATMAGFADRSTRCMVDPLLALWVFLGYWAMVACLFPRDGRGRPPATALLGLYVAAGLAFLTKGAIGVGLIAAGAAGAVAGLRRWEFFSPWRTHLAGLGLLAALCAVWPAMLHARGGHELLDRFLLDNLLYRFLPPEDGSYTGGHTKPFWFYLGGAPRLVAPWLLAAPALVHVLLRRRLPGGWNRGAVVVLAAIFPVGLLALSVPGTKRTLYLLPLFAPLACALGVWLSDAAARWREPHPLDRATETVFAALLIGLAAAGIGLAMVGTVAPQVLADARNDLAIFFTGRTAAGVAALAVLVGSASILALRRRRSGAGSGWPILVAALFGVVLAYETAGLALLDPGRNLHRMTADLARLGALERPLLGFGLGETATAIVPFDTGRDIRNTNDPDSLRGALDASPGSFVLVGRTSFARIPPDLRPRLEPIGDWRFSERRVYRLFAPSPTRADPMARAAPPKAPMPPRRP